MPYKPRRSLAPSEEQEAIRLHLQDVPLRQIAEHLDSSYGTIQRLISRYRQGTPNGQPALPEPPSTDNSTDSVERHMAPPPSAPTTALQTIESVRAPEPSSVHTDAHPYAQLLARVEALESHQAVVDAYLATWQAMHKAAQPMHTAAVQAMHTDVHTWENPDDAKPERWNLLLPRGLKREIDVQAKAAGIPASTLVTRLLMAAVHTPAQTMHNAEGGRDV